MANEQARNPKIARQKDAGEGVEESGGRICRGLIANNADAGRARSSGADAHSHEAPPHRRPAHADLDNHDSNEGEQRQLRNAKQPPHGEIAERGRNRFRGSAFGHI